MISGVKTSDGVCPFLTLKSALCRAVLRAPGCSSFKSQQLLSVAQSEISDMTFVAIRRVDHCALDRISETSRPAEYPSGGIQKMGAVGQRT